jgi:hypothetical protein
MDTNEMQDVIRQLAEQAYKHHLLVKLLVQRGHLTRGEADAQWNDEEWKKFLRDFWGANFPGVVPPPDGIT